ncbi:hypothetical protein M3Y94_00239900 [Aphelenchoides besseyi]|nr:hypothetical protein M3Y94_00239900 [Aphelenchoides besseyi]
MERRPLPVHLHRDYVPSRHRDFYRSDERLSAHRPTERSRHDGRENYLTRGSRDISPLRSNGFHPLPRDLSPIRGELLPTTKRFIDRQESLAHPRNEFPSRSRREAFSPPPTREYRPFIRHSPPPRHRDSVRPYVAQRRSHEYSQRSSLPSTRISRPPARGRGPAVRGRERLDVSPIRAAGEYDDQQAKLKNTNGTGSTNGNRQERQHLRSRSPVRKSTHSKRRSRSKTPKKHAVETDPLDLDVTVDPEIMHRASTLPNTEFSSDNTPPYEALQLKDVEAED